MFIYSTSHFPVIQMKFVEAILCNNATDDHCWEFVSHKGLEPLLKFLRLPNLPIDFPTSSACQSVASVCKAILVGPKLCQKFGLGCNASWLILPSILCVITWLWHCVCMVS